MTEVPKQIKEDEKSYAKETRKPATASKAAPNYLNNALLDTAYMKAAANIDRRFGWINNNEQENKIKIHMQNLISKAVAYLVQLKIDQKLK